MSTPKWNYMRLLQTQGALKEQPLMFAIFVKEKLIIAGVHNYSNSLAFFI